MIRRTTWVLVLVFAGLVSLVWLVPWWEGRNPQPTPTIAATVEPIFEAGTISWTTVQGSDGNVVVVEKTAGTNQWTVKQPEGLEFDPTLVQSAMTSLEESRIQTDLPQQPPKDVMGLDKPAYTLTIMLKDGAERIIQVGKVTPTGSGYYAQVGNQPAVILNKTDLDPVLNLLTAGQSGSTGTPEARQLAQPASATPTP